MEQPRRQRVNREGLFYILQLVPDLRPERVKFGWTQQSLQGRLRPYRTAAPTFTLAGAWPCLGQWEQAVMVAVTDPRDTRVGREVWDVADLGALLERTDGFFASRDRAAVTEVERSALAPRLVFDWPSIMPVDRRLPAVPLLPLPSLRRERAAVPYSLRELASLAGISLSTICHLEAGVPARAATIGKLAAALEVPWQRLAGLSEPGSVTPAAVAPTTE